MVVEMTGKTFGRLTVLRRQGSDKYGNATWHCSCVCGNEITAMGTSLRSGHTKSCGCLQRDLVGKQSAKHGLLKEYSSEYSSWRSMMDRCYDASHDSYKSYGGKGIAVCERWHDFKNFVKDMDEKPTANHTIDRIDNEKGYNPSNCRWATKVEQSRNQRVRKNSKSGVRGVYYDKSRGKYLVQIKANGKINYIGRYDCITDAEQARKQAELKYWGKSS